MDELSGDVAGVMAERGELKESSLAVEEDELKERMTGALYESIFVVETSSIGAEIWCRSTGLFKLADRVGDGGETSSFFSLLDVKARASDILG